MVIDRAFIFHLCIPSGKTFFIGLSRVEEWIKKFDLPNLVSLWTDRLVHGFIHLIIMYVNSQLKTPETHPEFQSEFYAVFTNQDPMYSDTF